MLKSRVYFRRTRCVAEEQDKEERKSAKVRTIKPGEERLSYLC